MKISNEKYRIATGWIVGVVFFVLFKIIAPYPICNDGWDSSSIGHRGACSHHNGVNHHSTYHLLTFLGSIFLGFYATYILTPIDMREEKQPVDHVKLPCSSNKIEEHLDILKRNGIPDDLINQERKRLFDLVN
ncbi:TPA: hypothetical protein JBF18_15885, partial [Legionella pneumophila]|nr:hypothetical protein [Legionella pneumophila]